MPKINVYVLNTLRLTIRYNIAPVLENPAWWSEHPTRVMRIRWRGQQVSVRTQTITAHIMLITQLSSRLSNPTTPIRQQNRRQILSRSSAAKKVFSKSWLINNIHISSIYNLMKMLHRAIMSQAFIDTDLWYNILNLHFTCLQAVCLAFTFDRRYCTPEVTTLTISSWCC